MILMSVALQDKELFWDDVFDVQDLDFERYLFGRSG